MDISRNRYKGTSVPPWGWRGSWEEFLTLSLRAFLRSLLAHTQNRWSDKPLSLSQVRAWIREYEIFQPLLKELIARHPDAKNVVVCFEYELALEEGERPDILLHLPSGVTLAVECKNRGFPSRDDFSQVRRYERQLTIFHSVRRVRPIVLLLQTAQTALTVENEGNMTICDASELGLKKLSSLMESEIESRLDEQEETFSPAECYRPSVELAASVARAVNNATANGQATADQAAIVARALNETRERGDHILIALPGEKSTGKTALGLRVAAGAWEQGIPSIYLTGDEPPPEDVDAILRKVGNSVGWIEASCFIRGMSCFPRYASRHPLNSPFRIFVFDNTNHCLFPSSDNFPLHETALIVHADAQPWAVVLVLIDFQGGPFTSRCDLTASIKHWFQRLLLHKSSSKWKFLCPQSFGVAPSAAERHGINLHFDSRCNLGRQPLPCPPLESDADPLQEARLRFNYHIAERNEEGWQKVKQSAWERFVRETGKVSSKKKFTWSKELLTFEFPKLGRSSLTGVTLIHEMAASGHLNEIPAELLTWDVLSLEEAQPGRTPIRHAAKYGYIEQVPPEAVAGHYDTVSRIAIEAVEGSRSAGRATRRSETCRWLIRVALARNIEARARLAEARRSIEQMVDDAIRKGSSIPAPLAFTSVTEVDCEPAASFLERYLSHGKQFDLDTSIFEFYLDRLIAFARSETKEINAERKTHTRGRAFYKRLEKPRPKSVPRQTAPPKQPEEPAETQIDLF